MPGEIGRTSDLYFDERAEWLAKLRIRECPGTKIRGFHSVAGINFFSLSGCIYFF